jgi:hypothetical protein
MTKHSILIQLDVEQDGSTRYKRFPKTSSGPTKGEQTDQKRSNEAIAEYSDIHNPNMQNQTH